MSGLAINDGTLLYAWDEAVSEYSLALETNTTLSVVTDNARFGGTCLRINHADANTGVYVRMDNAFSPTYDLSDTTSFVFRFHVDDPTYFSPNGIRVQMRSGGDWANTYTATCFTANMTYGANVFVLSKADFSAAGAADWSAIDAVGLRVYGGAADQPVVHVLGIHADEHTKPIICLEQDDGNNTTESLFDLWHSNGLVGTLNMIEDNADPTNIELADLDDLYAQGHDIAMHHTLPLVGESDATIRGWMDDSIAFLDTNGYKRGQYHYAYPLGEHNTSVISTLESWGMLTARTVRGISISGGRGLDNRLAIPSFGVADAHTHAADVKPVIDAAVTANAIQLMHYHLVGAAGHSMAEHEATVAYLVSLKDAGTIRVLTRSQLYRYLSLNAAARRNMQRRYGKYRR